MSNAEQLRSDSLKARLEAIRSIAAESVPDASSLLAAALADRDRRVCEASLKALSDRGDEDAIKALILALSDGRDWLRDAIDAALETIDADWAGSPAAQAVIDDFFSDLDSEASELRPPAEACLQRAGDPRTARQLRDAIIQRGAEGVALALERRAESNALNSLLDRLVDADPVRRKLAFETLALIHPYWHEEEAVQAKAGEIAEGLRSPHPGMRACSAEILASLGSPETIPALMDALAQDDFVRNTAEFALDAISSDWPRRPEATRVAKICVEHLKADNPSTRYSALLTLNRIGSEATAPHFAQALIDENPRIRRMASDCLEKLAPDWKRNKLARLAVPIAIGALDHPNDEIRREAQGLLGEIGGRPAVKALTDQLARSPEAGIMKALGAIRDVRAIRPLVSALLQGGAFLHHHAIAALEAIDPNWPQSDDVVERKSSFVRELREAESPEIRGAAARALGELGGDEALDPLRSAAAADPSADVRRDAAKASEKLRQRLKAARASA